MLSHLKDSGGEPLKIKDDFITQVFNWSFWVVPLGLLAGYCLSNLSVNGNLREERNRDVMFERVRNIADSRGDGNGVTSDSEWRAVYRNLCLEDNGMNGRDISYEYLQRYVSMSERALSKR